MEFEDEAKKQGQDLEVGVQFYGLFFMYTRGYTRTQKQIRSNESKCKKIAESNVLNELEYDLPSPNDLEDTSMNMC